MCDHLEGECSESEGTTHVKLQLISGGGFSFCGGTENEAKRNLFIEWLTESRYIQHLEAELKERLEEKNAQIRQLQVDLAIERRRKRSSTKALDRENGCAKAL